MNLNLRSRAVAVFLGTAFWFTASTSFANPAVTLARSASDTFAGVHPADTPASSDGAGHWHVGGNWCFPLAHGWLYTDDSGRVVRAAREL